MSILTVMVVVRLHVSYIHIYCVSVRHVLFNYRSTRTWYPWNLGVSREGLLIKMKKRANVDFTDM